jgi:hypothetical protein
MITGQERIAWGSTRSSHTRTPSPSNGSAKNVADLLQASNCFGPTRTTITRIKHIIRIVSTDPEIQGPLSSLVGCQPRALEVAGSNPAGPILSLSLVVARPNALFFSLVIVSGTLTELKDVWGCLG